MKRFLAVAAVLLGSCLPAFAAGVVVPAEQRYIPFSGDIEKCDDADSLWWIVHHFSHKESEYWNSPLEIQSIDDIHEIGMRSNGVQYIPRRYCVGHAHMSDMKTRTIVYQIIEHAGFAGLSNNTEWCVVGLDRDLSYAPACAILKPLIDRYAHDQIKFPPQPLAGN